MARIASGRRGRFEPAQRGLALLIVGQKMSRATTISKIIWPRPLFMVGANVCKKIHVMLERLESSYEHKEVVSLESLTIEHLMPQTLTEEWENDLGDEWQSVHSTWLHTLGNLTLTAYNSELSNAPWAKKQRELAKSHLELNRSVADSPRWDAASIEARGEMLAERALSIWAPLGDSTTTPAMRGVAHTVPVSVTILGDVTKSRVGAKSRS